MNKKLIITVVAVLLLGATGFYFFCNRQAGTEDQVLSTTTPQIQGTTTTKWDNSAPTTASELTKVTPGLIEYKQDGEGKQILSLEFEKIKKTAADIIKAKDPGSEEYYAYLIIRAVGKRYVLMTNPTVRGGNDIVVDFVNKTSKPISSVGDSAFYTKYTSVYISGNKISYYKLDAPDSLVLPNSELSGGETYHAGDGDFVLSPKETHTDTTLTIAIFDSKIFLQDPNNPTDPGGFKKLRDITFTLP